MLPIKFFTELIPIFTKRMYYSIGFCSAFSHLLIPRWSPACEGNKLGNLLFPIFSIFWGMGEPGKGFILSLISCVLRHIHFSSNKEKGNGPSSKRKNKHHLQEMSYFYPAPLNSENGSMHISFTILLLLTLSVSWYLLNSPPFIMIAWWQTHAHDNEDSD